MKIYAYIYVHTSVCIYTLTGVALLARYPIENVQIGLPDSESDPLEPQVPANTHTRTYTNSHPHTITPEHKNTHTHIRTNKHTQTHTHTHTHAHTCTSHKTHARRSFSANAYTIAFYTHK